MAALGEIGRYPAPDQPHAFVPRSRGAQTACAVCGGVKEDRIHYHSHHRKPRKKGTAHDA